MFWINKRKRKDSDTPEKLATRLKDSVEEFAKNNELDPDETLIFETSSGIEVNFRADEKPLVLVICLIKMTEKKVEFHYFVSGLDGEKKVTITTAVRNYFLTL